MNRNFAINYNGARFSLYILSLVLSFVYITSQNVPGRVNLPWGVKRLDSGAGVSNLPSLHGSDELLGLIHGLDQVCGLDRVVCRPPTKHVGSSECSASSCLVQDCTIWGGRCAWHVAWIWDQLGWMPCVKWHMF